MQQQQPTLRNVRIRSTRDASQIFFAVARNVLPMTTRRLDAEERRAIASGNVYIWEERCANSEATGMGMERWTDGMGWGPSRVRDDFLFYHQRETEPHDDPTHPSARWANMMRRREPRPGNPSFSRSESERLIKQTYSVHVSLPDDRPRGMTRKWHLTAYFSQPTLDSLGTIDSMPGVGGVPVPDGWFRSARSSKAKRAETTSGDELASPAPEAWLAASAAPPPHSPFPAHAGMPQHHPGRAPLDYYPDHHDYYELEPAARRGSLDAGAGAGPRLPGLADAGLRRYYREPSPPRRAGTVTPSSASSASSDPGLSPHPSPGPARTLVPLAYLEARGRTRGPARSPLDEQFLRRFERSQIAAAAAGAGWAEGKPAHVHVGAAHW